MVPADLDIPIVGQLPSAQLSLGNTLEPGPLEVVSLDARSGVGRSGRSRGKTCRGTWTNRITALPVRLDGDPNSPPTVGD